MPRPQKDSEFRHMDFGVARASGSLADKGDRVACHRCGAERFRGKACACEKWTPEGEPVAAEERVA